MFFLLQLCIAACVGIVCVTKADVPEFIEGPSNSIISINGVVSETITLRCTVKTPVVELTLLPLPEAGENWELKNNKTDDNKWLWIEVVITNVKKDNEGNMFNCTAINSDGNSSHLTYSIDKVYDGIIFEEGATNGTITTDLTVGVLSRIMCTIKSTDLKVTSLKIDPTPPIGNTDYRVVGDGITNIGMEFDDIDDDVPTEFECFAISNVTNATLTYKLSFFDGIQFSEGPVNSTINNTQVTDTPGTSIRCTITIADPPLESLRIEPNEPVNEDYRIKSNGTDWIEVEFIKITDAIPSSFQCIAENNLTRATLNYDVSVKDPVPPEFDYGINNTIWTDIATSANRTLYCTLISGALPAVKELIVAPPAIGNVEHNYNEDNTSVQIVITGADNKNAMDYVCIASNGIETTLLIYQTYVGGPPTGVDVTLDPKIKSNKIMFSLSVTDRSNAPAHNILIHIPGVTNGNLTLNVTRPETYDNEIAYNFIEFLATSLDSIKGNSSMIIYAKNDLGDAHVKDISIAIPVDTNKSNSGKIAAGILVPFFLVIGAVIIGVVVFYFWSKNKKNSLGFSQVGGGDDIDDATKSTYGSL